MVLMGESEVVTHASAIGLLTSSDGIEWQLLPERNHTDGGPGGIPLVPPPLAKSTGSAAAAAKRLGRRGGAVVLTDSGVARGLVVRKGSKSRSAAGKKKTS